MLRLVSELPQAELLAFAHEVDYPKWSTLCLLRSVGLPTLDALLLRPRDQGMVRDAAVYFSRATGSDRILVRSDGGVETSSYYRGGHSFAGDVAVTEAERLCKSGRAVLLMEPTNRFTNRFSACMRLTASGDLLIEALGAGFDVSDLNRGEMQAATVVHIDGIDWTRYADLHLSDIRIRHNHGAQECAGRRTQRLETIAISFLPQLGEVGGPGAALDPEQWLRSQGFVDLWEPYRPPSMSRIRRLYEDACLVGQAYPRGAWTTLGMAASELDNGRFIYWDVVDGARKYGVR